MLEVNDLPYKVHYVIFLHYSTTKKFNMLFSFVTTNNKQIDDIQFCNAKTKRTYVDRHDNKTNKITYNKVYAKFILYSCFGSLNVIFIMYYCHFSYYNLNVANFFITS